MSVEDGVNKISGFLKKYIGLVPKSLLVKNAVIKEVKKEYGIVLKEDDVIVSGKTVFIKTSSTTKNHLFLNKQKILKSVSREIGEGKIEDIR